MASAYLTPEQQRLQEITRQRNMAMLLQNRQMTNRPKQATAATAIGDIGSALLMKRKMDDLRTEEQDITQGYNQKVDTANENIAGLLMGKPATPAVGEMGPQIPQDAVAPDRNAAMAMMLQHPDPSMRQLAMQGMIKQQIGGNGTYGLTPIYGTDDKGNLVLMQANSQGGVAPVELPEGVKPVRPMKTMDIGGSQIFYNPYTNQVQGGVNKTLPPQDQPQNVYEGKKAQEQATADVEKPKLQKAAKSALSDLERQTDVVESTIDEALGLISGWSTGWGAMLDWMPESDAGKLRNALNTIKANVGFDKLQRLRDNSPTGGALGQVSEMENKLLQAVNGALDPKQSAQLEKNLNNIKTLYREVLKEKQAAYQSDFGNIQQPEETTNEPSIDDLLNKYGN